MALVLIFETLILQLTTFYYEARAPWSQPTTWRRPRVGVPQGLSISCFFSETILLTLSLWMTYGSLLFSFPDQNLDRVNSCGWFKYFDDAIMVVSPPMLPAAISRLVGFYAWGHQKLHGKKMPFIWWKKGVPQEVVDPVLVAGVEAPNLMEETDLGQAFKFVGGVIGVTAAATRKAAGKFLLKNLNEHIRCVSESPLPRHYKFEVFRDRKPCASLVWRLQASLPTLVVLLEMQRVLIAFVVVEIFRRTAHLWPRGLLCLDADLGGLGVLELVFPRLDAQGRALPGRWDYGRVPAQTTTLLFFDQLTSIFDRNRWLAARLMGNLKRGWSLPISAAQAAHLWANGLPTEREEHTACAQTCLAIATLAAIGVAFFAERDADGKVLHAKFFLLELFVRRNEVQLLTRGQIVRRLTDFFRRRARKRVDALGLTARFVKIRHFAAKIVFGCHITPSSVTEEAFLLTVGLHHGMEPRTPGAYYIRRYEVKCGCGHNPVFPFHPLFCKNLLSRVGTPRHNALVALLVKLAVQHGSFTRILADDIGFDSIRGTRDQQRPDIVAFACNRIVIIEVASADDKTVTRQAISRAQADSLGIIPQRGGALTIKSRKYQGLIEALRTQHQGLPIHYGLFVMGNQGRILPTSVHALKILGVPPRQIPGALRTAVRTVLEHAIRAVQLCRAQQSATAVPGPPVAGAVYMEEAVSADDTSQVSQPDPKALQALATSHNVSIDGDYSSLPLFQTHSITSASADCACPECGTTQRLCCQACHVCTVCASKIICADTEPVPTLLALNTEELEGRAEVSDTDPSPDTLP